MRTPLLLLAVVATPVIALTAACGSSPATNSSSGATATPSASTAGANAACATANTKIGALTSPGDPTTVTAASQLAPWATYLDQLLPYATQEQTDLAAASDGSSLTSSFNDLITATTALDAAAKGTDVSAFQTAVTNFTTANNAFHAAGQAANLTDCAK